MQRRSWLKLGLATAALVSVAGGSLALLRPGLHASRLSESGREVFAAVGAAILDGSLPADPLQRAKAFASLLDRIDALVAGLPDHAQAELSQLIALLASAPGRRAITGLAEPWRVASATQVRESLQSMRTSSLKLRQQAYHALHDIVGGAYFSEPSTWSMLGYPGPVAI